MPIKGLFDLRAQTGKSTVIFSGMCGLYLTILAVIHGNYSILDGLAFNLESVLLD